MTQRRIYIHRDILKNRMSLDAGYGASLKDWIEYEEKLV